MRGNRADSEVSDDRHSGERADEERSDFFSFAPGISSVVQVLGSSCSSHRADEHAAAFPGLGARGPVVTFLPLHGTGALMRRKTVCGREA